MMELTIGIVTIAYLWLLIETDFLTVRLPYGKARPENYIKLLTTTVDLIPQLTCPESPKLLMAATKESYFMPGDIEENSDVVCTNIINVGAKIL